ncbi:MAG: hypothetical protein QM770_09200 [Tepidisphaeraceae bacterium]
MANFLPRRDAELRTWSTAFRDQIVADPNAYGLTSAQAAHYASLHDAFEQCLSDAVGGATRGPRTVMLKDEARAALESAARGLGRIIRATPGVTDPQRVALGLSQAQPQPTPVVRVDDFAPIVRVTSTHGRTISIRLDDPTHPSRKGKPRGVVGAAIFAWTGHTLPKTTSAWRFVCNTTRPTCDITFDASHTPGTKVWLTARWLDSQLQPGMPAAPVMQHIGFEFALAA